MSSICQPMFQQNDMIISIRQRQKAFEKIQHLYMGKKNSPIYYTTRKLSQPDKLNLQKPTVNVMINGKDGMLSL